MSNIQQITEDDARRPRRTRTAARRTRGTITFIPNASTSRSVVQASSITLRNVQGRSGGLQRRDISIRPPSPQTQPQASTSETTLDTDTPMDVDVPEAPAATLEPRQKTRNRGIDRIRRWLPFRQDYLDSMLCLEAACGPSSPKKCHKCHVTDPIFRCQDCFAQPLFCQGCLLVTHEYVPLHSIEEWNGVCFEKSSLQRQGLRVQLGHPVGSGPCPIPGRNVKKFAVCDISGFHEVNVIFCACDHPDEGVIPLWSQLFRVGWFPASREKPKTVFTLAVLDFFQQLNFQSKTNLSDFQRALSRYTDNSGRKFWNRRRPFAEVVREYRHLVALKRGGRCHDPSGATGTPPGSLALECPACPHPERNLPKQWNEVPMEMRWLYTLYLMLDANFKLKLKDKGIEDLELASGWAYYVDEQNFQKHIDDHHRQHGDGIEENTCSAEHNAILKANLRKEGYIASGVGAVFCARHCLVRPNGVGDLQKGERYVNMDYLVLQTLSLAIISLVLLLYDIACQYSKKFRKRVKNFPPPMQLSEEVDVRFAIPKKHFVVHGPNHSKYSLNYIQWVGRTYGEGIESAWHVFNSVSMATREMGPAMRHEVLNDHWGSWNWEKILGFGFLMAKGFLDAYDMSAKQTQRFQDLNATFTKETITKWNAHLTRWKKDPSVKPDPFEELETRATLTEIRAKLAEEDARDIARGAVVQHEVSPSVFLHLGLDIEDQQRRLRVLAAEKSSATELASLQEKRSTLSRRIELWRKTQAIYLPVTVPLYAASSTSASTSSAHSPDGDDDDDDVSTITKAENITLWLPSELSPNQRTASYIKVIASKECEFRKAQAFDVLANIRRIRRIITGISEFKKLNLVNEGQQTSTRLRSYYDKFKQQIDHSASRYRAARKALSVLDPEGTWSAQLKVLRNEDIRGPTADKDDAAPHEGRRELSWIWLVQHAPPPEDGIEEDFCEGMRVEWAKSKARAERWSEEVILLQEEMRRVLEFLSWKASWWRSQVNRRADISPTLKEGLSAYAEKQACVHEDLAKSFASRWYQALGAHHIMPAWKTKYLGPKDIAIVPLRMRRGKRNFLEESSDESSSDEEDGDGDGV